MTTQTFSASPITSSERMNKNATAPARASKWIDGLIETARTATAHAIGFPTVLPGRWFL